MDTLIKLKVSLFGNIGFVITQNPIIGEYRKLWFSGEMENQLTKVKKKKRIASLKIGFVEETKIKNCLYHISYQTYCKPQEVEMYTNIIKAKIATNVSDNMDIATNMMSFIK
jgi:hypothetical protein